MNKTITYFLSTDENDRINFEIYNDDRVIVYADSDLLEFTDIKDFISQLRWVADELERGVVWTRYQY